jgi:transcriptional regulator with XRE-family HTH domain
MLGELVRARRQQLGLTLIDASAGTGVSISVLSRLENGKAIRTDSLFRALHGFGLAAWIMPKGGDGAAMAEACRLAGWREIIGGPSPTKAPIPRVELVMDKTAPTLFLDFDGTLHVGHGVIDKDGKTSLDNGRELFEFASILVKILRPYPQVEIVLTTGWLQRFPIDKVISFLPQELGQRVVDTTKDLKPRFSYEKNGEGRTDVIVSYVYGKRLKNWLAIDDAVFGAHKFGYRPGELSEHFLLLNSERGIGDASAQKHIQSWLEKVRLAEQPTSVTDQQSVRAVPERELPIFYASQLEITPRRTPEDIRRAMAEGRFAEMNPGLAGYDEDET